MSWGRRFAVGAAYVLFLVVLVEGSLQAFYYVTAGDFLFRRVGRQIYTHNPYAGYWVRPNLDFEHRTNEFRTQVYTNSEGFRVSSAREEYAIPKPASTLRILLLGPSFAFGWGVNQEDTFAAQLERMLKGTPWTEGRELEIVNAGVPSMDPFAQLDWFLGHGRELQPDLILQFAYASMDVAPSGLEIGADGHLGYRTRGVKARRIEALKQSATVFYGWIVLTRLRSLLGEEAPSAEVQGAGRALVERQHFDPESPELARSLGFYQDLHRAAADAGGGLLVVYFPLAYVVHPGDAARWRHLGVRNIEAQRAFDAAYCSYIDARGVPCLDITADLIRAASNGSRRLYYWLDIHWTPEGNRTAAEAVATRLLGDGH